MIPNHATTTDPASTPGGEQVDRCIVRCMSIQDMTWEERLRTAAIILRDAIEQQDYEEALRAAAESAESPQNIQSRTFGVN